MITFTLKENVGSGVSEPSLWTWLTSTLGRLSRTFGYPAIFNVRTAEQSDTQWRPVYYEKITPQSPTLIPQND